jgi:hypothetical protein
MNPSVAHAEVQNMIYRHFIPNDQPLPGEPNANALTARG